ncbi:acyltransferase [Humibacter sp. BT305]|nr:acyltransferase [Humibacter sp. BT305]
MTSPVNETRVASRAARRAPGASRLREFRPEIQGLRALSVTLVVIYHLWPGALPGGFIGVDVFFVISGFLISGHLLGEVRRTGRVDLRSFWARRIRRLLPASFLVLAATLIGVVLWTPLSERANELANVAASGTYVINWVLAHNAVDYLAQNNAESAVQQYWSLAVEEQFYVLWPLLLMATVLIAGAILRRKVTASSWSTFRIIIAIVLAGVFVASLTFSVYLTATRPGAAYFNTFVRAWEFAAGGLASILVMHLADRRGSKARTQGMRVVSEIVPWLGLVVIVVCALTFTGSLPFPGIVAVVPVVGALLVLAVDPPAEERFGLRSFSSMWPIKSVGTWSYSIYLWHWPLIVFFPLVFGVGIGIKAGLALGMASLLLGALTSKFVEDPARYSRWWSARRWRAYAFAAGAPAIVVAIVAAQLFGLQQSVSQASEQASAQLAQPCYGANAALNQAQCPDAFTATAPIDTAYASQDLDPNWCLVQLDNVWRSCTYGDPDGPKGTIAIVGDSHAAAMTPAFDTYFKDQGWRVITYTRFGCPALTTVPEHMLDKDPAEQVACTDWTKDVIADIQSRSDIDVVAYTDWSRAYFYDQSKHQEYVDEISSMWKSIQDSGKQVLFVQDIPGTGKDVGSVPTCLAAISVPAVAPCSNPRDLALIDDAVLDAVAQNGKIPVISTSQYFCTDQTCMTYVGGVVAYADNNHLSNTYARSIAPHLGPDIMAAIDSFGDR